jgi:transcription elongation regulator 1
LETPGITGTSEWAEVKRGIASDARYDAVGSSTLRGELFAAFIAKLSATSEPETPEQAAERKARERKERQAASLLEREGQVRDLNVKVSEDVERSRASAGREEGERLFGSLLVDVVRSHEQTWDSMLPILQQDRRFAHPSLRTGDKRRVFDEHVGRLGANKADALNKVFAAAAPELHTSYEDAYAALADDPLVLRLGLVGSALQERFGAWRRAREADARREFDALLAENRFVDFWGRMRNKAVDGAAAAVDEQEERDKGQGVHDGGDADMVALAQRMDLSEIKTILRRDRRYRQFDHMPEVRERWLREHLESMEGTKGAETVHKVG